MLIKRFAVGTLALSLMFVGACEPAGQPGTPTDGTAPPPPPPRDTGLGVGTDTTADREQIVQPLVTRLDTARDQIDQLRADEDRVPQENRAAFEAAMGDVQSAYSNAVLHVDRLRAAEGAQLTTMRNQVDPIMEELESSIQHARSLIGGQQQPGMQPGMQQPGQQQPGQAPGQQQPPTGGT